METNSSELQQVIDVIRQEHRRTQLIFGVSIIILAVVIMLIAPGVINMESVTSGGNRDSVNNPDAQLPVSSHNSVKMPAASSTTATTTTAH